MSKRLFLLSVPGIVILTSVLSGCWSYPPWEKIRGEGPTINRTVDLPKIRGIILQNAADIVITQGNRQKVTIEAQANILDNINFEVEGDVWRIRNKRPVWHAQKVKIHITLKDLRLIKVSGSGKIESNNRFRSLNKLELTISGSGEIDLKVSAEEIQSRISGSGNIHLSGEVRKIDFVLSGSGRLEAFNLKSEKGDLKISGSGSARVWTTDRLDVRISGSGNIKYKGNPKIRSSISGSGDLIPEDN